MTNIFRLSALTLSLAISFYGNAECQEGNSPLPSVLNREHPDYPALQLKHEAAIKSSLHQLPNNLNDWKSFKDSLKTEVVNQTGALLNQKLPPDMRETGKIQMPGYTIRKMYFQTRPGIYATANLYVPDGKGKFPGVVVMMGHSPDGRFYPLYQQVGASLALHGYVSLCIDPWGSGERTTIHGIFEDHGDENNLGSSLLDLGETLMGMEITDNIRAVDLLCSLPFVDSDRIGATGSSGGGNQTMWLTAMDERVKASVPVVSAGTFEAYILGSPCICEVLQNGLNITEESGIISMIAPRAIKMINHQKDDISAFLPREMMRSFRLAQPVFKMTGVENNIAYQVFDLTHGYFPQDREVMLGWFNKHLKGGTDEPVKEAAPDTVQYKRLMTFPTGKRDLLVVTTEQFCNQRGKELRSTFLSEQTFNKEPKRKELKNMLGVNEGSLIVKANRYPVSNGWERIALETSDGHVLPLLIRPGTSNNGEYVIICSNSGKNGIPSSMIDDYLRAGTGVVLCDLSGTGETTSIQSHLYDRKGDLRTLSRSEYWLGRTLLGEWVNDLKSIVGFLESDLKSGRVSIDGSREAGLAALFMSALNDNTGKLMLRDVPVSYLFDKRENIDYFSMAVHIPGFLKWGDVSLASALSGAEITFINPVTMSGSEISKEKLREYEAEYELIRRRCGGDSKTIFIQSDVKSN